MDGAAVEPKIHYDCDPCLERSRYQVQAIVHGTKDDPLWQQVQAAAVQAAMDMNVQFDMKLNDKYDVSQMVKDINKVTTTDAAAGPDVLIVSIPSVEVQSAVMDVVNAGIPVVGLNAGSQMGTAVGVLDFVAPDDVAGGNLAGETMVLHGASSGKFLFVNDELGNIVNVERVTGFKSAFNSTVTVEEFVIESGISTSAMTSSIASKLNGCPYQGVLLSGPRTVQAAVSAYASAGCSISNMPMGSFDTSNSVFVAIGNDQLTFTIDNQQYLQGALSTVLASLVATTGKSLASSAEAKGGAYLTGPKAVTKSTLPSDTVKSCMNEAFPVCPMNKVRIFFGFGFASFFRVTRILESFMPLNYTGCRA